MTIGWLSGSAIGLGTSSESIAVTACFFSPGRLSIIFWPHSWACCVLANRRKVKNDDRKLSLSARSCAKCSTQAPRVSADCWLNTAEKNEIFARRRNQRRSADEK